MSSRRFLSTGLLTLLVSLGLLGGGCARHYVITTINGTKILTASKPKRVDSNYVYKDANGEEIRISALRVRVIEPYSKGAYGNPMTLPELK